MGQRRFVALLVATCSTWTVCGLGSTHRDRVPCAGWSCCDLPASSSIRTLPWSSARWWPSLQGMQWQGREDRGWPQNEGNASPVLLYSYVSSLGNAEGV